MAADLPYNGTEGYVDRPTSQARAEAEVMSGRAPTRRARILALLEDRAGVGATWREASLTLEGREHHSGFTSSLSTLHKAGKVVALTETRGKCSVYVLPKYVGGRETVPRAYVRRRPPTVPTSVMAAALAMEDWANREEGPSAHSLLCLAPEWAHLRTLIDHAKGTTP